MGKKKTGHDSMVLDLSDETMNRSQAVESSKDDDEGIKFYRYKSL